MTTFRTSQNFREIVGNFGAAVPNVRISVSYFVEHNTAKVAVALQRKEGNRWEWDFDHSYESRVGLDLDHSFVNALASHIAYSFIRVIFDSLGEGSTLVTRPFNPENH